MKSFVFMIIYTNNWNMVLEKITSEHIIKFVGHTQIELKSTHRKLCIPIIKRMCRKMLNGNKFGNVKVCDDALPYENEAFVIIDDDKFLNDLPSHIKMNLILTSPLVGLTDELADNAISILNQGSYTYA